MSECHWLELPNKQRYSYQLVKSNRAKYIRIKISREGDLSVVLPLGISAKHAHEFIHKKSHWIAKNVKKSSSRINIEFPDFLNLTLLGERWDIDYVKANCHSKDDPKNRISLEEKFEKQLVITGNIENWIVTKKILNHWCRIKSKRIFTIMLQGLAEEHGFHFNKLTIRTQKTRWGSCSTKKNINLNSKLLLMPENIVKYVMIHELCHTIEMNHSSNFWQLVGDCDKNYKDNRKQLKIIGANIFL